MPYESSSPRKGLILAFITAICYSSHGVGEEVVIPNDFDTITEALDDILADPDASGDTVIVEPGTYREAFSLPDNVVLIGRETARTFLRGTGEGPVVTANGTRGARISNFTFESTGGDGPAIDVSAGSDLIISNNVFAVDSDETAVRVQGLSLPRIQNNVFFETGVAIDTGGNALTAQNNAFIGNNATFSPDPVDERAIARNGFFDNTDTATFGSNPVTDAPEFVDSGELDFHLEANSPYIDEGLGTDALDDTDADIGAYGGDHAEGTPIPVGTPTVAATTDTSITLQWPDNSWYRLGGYKVYYDSDRSGRPYEGTDAADGSSPIDVGDVTQYTLEGLSPPAAVDPDAPVLAPPEPLDGAMKLSWSTVPAASGYLVHYGVTSPDENTVDVGDVTRHTLSGLENGTTYHITVSAYATSRYFLAVSAYADFGDRPESELSEEVTATFGTRVESLPSNHVSDFPEAVVAFPNLPDKNGCFIATAAYGHYGADEVQLLRTFRDRFLLPHAAGRAFVGWYYRHSPEWVRWLEDHPRAKPMVRVALLPAIGAAAFMLNTAPTVKWGVVLLILLTLSSLTMARRRARSL